MRPRTWVLLLAALFALMQLATVEGRDTPDSKNYVSYALSLTGADKREAAAATIDQRLQPSTSDRNEERRAATATAAHPTTANVAGEYHQCRNGEP